MQESIFYKASCSGTSVEHPVCEPLNSLSPGMTHLDALSLPRQEDDIPFGSRDGILTVGLVLGL